MSLFAGIDSVELRRSPVIWYAERAGQDARAIYEALAVEDVRRAADALTLLVFAPLMGAVFAMFLPFIGFAVLFTFLGKKAFAMGRSGAVDVAATMTPNWLPVSRS